MSDLPHGQQTSAIGSGKYLGNTLKVRDDHRPVRFEAATEEGEFKLCEGAEASWAPKGQTFGLKELRGHIEPWLTALFQ